MRVVAGILLGLVLFFPGITLLQWVAEDLLGQQMTLTDGCLVMIIILLSIIIVTRIHADRSGAQKGQSRRQPRAAGQEPTPYSSAASTSSQRPSAQRSDRRRH